MRNKSKNDLIVPAAGVIEDSRRSNTTYDLLRFPESIGAHAIVLNFKNYDYNDNELTTTLKPEGTLVLPLPGELSETYDVRMNGVDLGFSGSMLATAAPHVRDGSFNAANMGENTAKATGEIVKNLLVKNGMTENAASTLLNDFELGAKYMARSSLEGLLPGAGAGIDVGLGSAVNPHVAVNFDGMNLKSHNFTWKLSPNNDRESRILRRIQNFTRRKVTPKYKEAVSDVQGLSQTLSKAILKYPSMVDIFFLGIDQSYFYYFKRCLVQQLQFDYTPNGHVVMKGGRPGFVGMNMQLIETTIHTSDDYEDIEQENA